MVSADSMMLMVSRTEPPCIVGASGQLLRLFGAASSLIGKSLSALFSDEDAAAVNSMLQSLSRGETHGSQGLSVRWASREGASLRLLARASPLYDPSSAVRFSVQLQWREPVVCGQLLAEFPAASRSLCWRLTVPTFVSPTLLRDSPTGGLALPPRCSTVLR